MFLAKAMRILEEVEELEDIARPQVEDLVGHIRISGSTTLGVKMLTPALARFTNAHPAVSVEMTLLDRNVDLVAEGFDRETVARVDRLLNIAEYKRRQAAPGVKVTEKNFGRDRRYPITNRFRDSGKPLPKPDDSLVSRAGKVSAEAFEG